MKDLISVLCLKREKTQLNYFFVSFLPSNKPDLGANHTVVVFVAILMFLSVLSSPMQCHAFISIFLA